MRSEYLKHTLVISFVLSVIPFMWIWILSGFSYPSIPIEFVDDSLYYFGRSVEVSQGHVFIGNQYSLEHRDDTTVAFFVADWIWSIPLLLGASLQVTIIVNQILYFLIVAYLLHIILSRLRVQLKYMSIGVVFIVLLVYWFLARPVAMQVVFPLFLLWLISLYYFIHNPLQRKAQIVLALVSALSLYVYTYLTQIIIVSSGIGLCAIFFRKFHLYKTAWFSVLGASVLSVPFLLYTWKQINHPFYLETLARIGLVQTHMIGFAAVFYILIIILLSVIIWFQKNLYTKEELSIFILVSAGLFVATISNVITGKDLEVAVHIGRFVELWFGLIFVIVLSRITNFRQRKEVYVVLSLLCICILRIGLVQCNVWKNIDQNLLYDQRYKTVLSWLRENTVPDSVVLTDDRLASYIPIETDNYVLFSPNSLLYLSSDKEVEERYLLSRVFMNLSIEDIKKDMRKYAGAGHTAHQHMVHNRVVRLCIFVTVGQWEEKCGEYSSQYTLKGESYFGALEVKHLFMKQHYADEIKKFSVSYVVVDKKNNQWEIPNDLKQVWGDDFFEVYTIN